METDWDSVLQFVADPLEGEYAERRQVQMPTPPYSQDGSPVVDDANPLVSVSTTFFPTANLLPLPPDVILLSSDAVFFYVHSHLLIASSDNAFRGLLPPPTPRVKGQEAVVPVPETSPILNIILHAVYDISPARYSPSFPTFVTVVNHLPVYGISPKLRIVPSTPLFALLLTHAPHYPLELFALAASHDLYDLAVSTSSHLLSYPVASITDEMAERIGPVYLKRLFFLHFGRSDALKRVLLPPPHPHPPTPLCDFTDQKKLTRAWALASAYLAWDARPDLSTSTMESALRPLAEHLACAQCQQALRDRIKNLVVQWSVVKRTI